ncbi:hypothetical protein CYMTET_12098, partial [Cymbomonas tetramitiformis]
EQRVGHSGGVTPIWSHWQFAPSHAPPGQQQAGHSVCVAPIWSHWQFVHAHAPLGEQQVGHSVCVAPVCPPLQFVPAQAPPMVAPQASMHSSKHAKNTHQAPSIDEPPPKKVKQVESPDLGNQNLAGFVSLWFEGPNNGHGVPFKDIQPTAETRNVCRRKSEVKQALASTIFHNKEGDCTACERKGYATPEELEVAVDKTKFSNLRDLADRYQTKLMPGDLTFAKWYRRITQEHAKPKPKKH